MSTVPLWIESVPPDLKRAIAARVEAEGTSMNDVLVGLLAKRYKVPFEPTGRRSPAVDVDKLDILLRVPDDLRRKIRAAAAEGDTSRRDLIVRFLCKQFGTAFAPAPRTSSAAAA